MTGLKIINGGGRTEVQAAHIRPVPDRGPDSVRNGLALSGTVHWMFDRGLISIDDDYSLIVAERGVDQILSDAFSILTVAFVCRRAQKCGRIRSFFDIIATTSSKADDGRKGGLMDKQESVDEAEER